MAGEPAIGTKSMDDIMSLCKRRGFVFQASDIYGGINGFWDYGPLGAQMKKNLRDAWWQDMIMNPCWGRTGPNGQKVKCLPVETRIIQHPRVWEASGHVGGFNDPMVDDTETKQRFRADHCVGVNDIQGLHVGGPGGNVFTEDEILNRWRTGDVSVASIPDLTIVANNADEALETLQHSKDVKRRLRGEIQRVERMGDTGEIVILVKTNQPPYQQGFVLRPVPESVLTEDNERVPSPFTGKRGVLTKPRQFNLMFFTYTGAVFNEDSKVYLRPETAQGIFVQFKNVVDSTRVKMPFGIGNTGTSFRNEVTPRNFTFRSREFDQAELEFFCHEDEAKDWYKFWRDFRMEWWEAIGLAGENLILREHDADELSHYSSGTSDVEYRFPFTSPGYGELEGIAHRGNYDLTQHQQHSKAKLEFFDTDRGETLPNGSKKGERYLPHCIEPAAGLDRGVLALLCEAYQKDESRPSPEYLSLHPRIAPIKAAVFPLVNKDGMPEVAEKLHADLFKRFGHAGFIETDAKQSIGKRYARMDEAGCPVCFTVDGQTLEDQTVTSRDRDSLAQDRVAIDKVVEFVADKLGM